MSNSRNDYHRNSFKEYDDEKNGYIKAVKEKNNHRREKRINNALRSKDIDLLYGLDYEDDQDY